MVPIIRVNCAACGSLDSVCIVRTPDYETNGTIKFEVSHCSHCGLVYTSVRPELEALFSEYYPDEYLCYGVKTDSSVANFINEKRVHGQIIQRADLLAKHIAIKEGMRILDVGCATGRFLMYFKNKYSLDVHGVEPNRRLCNILKEQGINIHNSTLEDAALPGNFFDIISMFHVLEHVWDPFLTMKKLNIALKHDGLLYLEIPNFDATARKVFGKYWFNYHQPRHLTHFTEKTLTRIITECGFEIVKFKYEFRPTINAISIKYAVRDRPRLKILHKIVSDKNPIMIMIGIGLEIIFNVFGRPNTLTAIIKKTGDASDQSGSLLKQQRIDYAGNV